MSEPLPPPGWYVDPGDPDVMRWWDGRAWTQHTGPPSSRRRPGMPEMPWRAWAPWLVAMAVATFVCFGFGESTTLTHPGRWFATGFGLAAIFTFACAATTFSKWRLPAIAALGLLASAIVSLALFSMSAPSTSRSCDNNGQPPSAGTFDCDTPYGLGGPIILVAFWIPAFGLAAAGVAGRRLIAQPRDE